LTSHGLHHCCLNLCRWHPILVTLAIAVGCLSRGVCGCSRGRLCGLSRGIRGCLCGCLCGHALLGELKPHFRHSPPYDTIKSSSHLLQCPELEASRFTGLAPSSRTPCGKPDEFTGSGRAHRSLALCDFAPALYQRLIALGDLEQHTVDTPVHVLAHAGSDSQQVSPFRHPTSGRRTACWEGTGA